MAISRLELTVEDRKKWMATLACSSLSEVERTWRELSHKPEFHFLRRPETGLIMVRARAGGKGVRFNLGEMVITRCSVRIDSGQVGCAYVMGSSHRHAELAAVFDALMQDRRQNRGIAELAIAPLAAIRRRQEEQKAAAAAATKVDFYTLVRGE
jgi:alpha-D-ribose 1-methylphosphonate 5-triphosphate synthase subunit PhnG